MDKNYAAEFSQRSMRCISGLVMKTPTILYKAYVFPAVSTCQTVWKRIGGSTLCILSVVSFVKGEMSRNRKEKYFFYFASVILMFMHGIKEARHLILALRHK